MNIDEEILYFVFRIAMGDATQQQAYTANNKSWLKERNLFDLCKIALGSLIGNILSGKYTTQQQDDYDKDFCNTAISVCSEVNNYKNNVNNQLPPFNFGHTQKLINMMVKYFFITSYGSGSVPKSYFDYCHCPMDGVMLGHVWNNRNTINNAINNQNNANGQQITSANFPRTGWSNMAFVGNNNCPQRYCDFQRYIQILAKNNKTSPVIPIEYDYLVW